MNVSSILKKTLPIVLAIFLVVIIAITVSAVKTNSAKGVDISEKDTNYITFTETVNGKQYSYSITRDELYQELKYGIGLSSTVTMVNKDILKNAKDDQGISFWDLVTAEEIKEAIDEACYGEDVDIDDLTDEEKSELEESFIRTMYTGYGYKFSSLAEAYNSDSEIYEHYNLVLAKRAYAKYALAKEIAEADEDDPYFDDDTIEDYYDDNYNRNYWLVMIPFTSSDAANLAMQQIGVGIQTKVWKHVTVTEKEDADGNKTGEYTTTFGDDLTTQEQVIAMIKLYNLVYGYKQSLVEGTVTVDENGNRVFSEGADYALADNTAEILALHAAIEALEAEINKSTIDANTINPLLTAAIDACDAVYEQLDGNNITGVDTIRTNLETIQGIVADGTEEDMQTPYENIVEAIAGYPKQAYVFNVDNLDSIIYYDYQELYDYDSNLPSQFRNNYGNYDPFTSVNDSDAIWSSRSVESSSSVYYLAIRIHMDEAKELEEVRSEIIDQLTEDALTDDLIETKVAELRKEYGIVIYDSEIQANYIEAISSYDVEYKKTNKKNGSVIVKVSKDDFTKEYTADDLFQYMEKTSGLTTALSDIAYTRLLHNNLFNTYKDYSTGEWLGDEGKELKESIIQQIEEQRLYFLSGSYTSYGYDPSTMSWEDFMYSLSGVRDEQQMADRILYSSISTDYIAKALTFVETDGEGLELALKQSYTDAVNNATWALVLERMNDMIEDYYSVSGIHLLVSMYDTVKDSVDADSDSTVEQINPSEWTEEQKALAKELIEKVQLYIQSAEGTYADKLQAVVDAYNDAPYAVKDENGNYVVAIDDDGEQYKYILTYAEVEIDLSKYKSQGLYLTYQNLSTFTNGSMVEAFDNAVQEIYKQDMADDVTDRITVYKDAIETEFGYHLYINLSSNKITTYDSYEVDENGNLVKETVDGEEVNKTFESVLPSLFEIRQYELRTALQAIDTTDWSEEDIETLNDKIEEITELLTTNVTTALTTYYDVIKGEIVGNYFTTVLQQQDLIKLIDSSNVTFSSPSGYDMSDLKMMIEYNFETVYSDNVTYLQKDDEKVFDITAEFSK